MQTGRDFCRTLTLYLPIQIPKLIVQNYLNNINEIYKHFKLMADTEIEPNPEVEAMQTYFDRLDKVKQMNKEI